MKNMMSILAFDNRSIKLLLDKENEEYFNDKFPLFFKSKDGESALDTALEYNQIRSLDMMVSYMIKYQNSFKYAYLFHDNLIDLISKGVKMTELFNSEIFNVNLEMEFWP